MSNQNRHGVFGTPPRDLPPSLIAFPKSASQYSPLLPGSANLEMEATGSLASFTMLAPPGTIERRFTLAHALRALAPGAPLLAFAPKDKGGSRLKKELESLGCLVEEESKAHQKICSTHSVPLNDEIARAIEEGAARLVDGIGLTQPGVFSWDRIDPGSALLVSCLPALSGAGADLGCGIGFLSRTVLAASKTIRSLDLYDVDRRALACARENVKTGKTAVTFHWADLRSSDLSGGALDFIVTNPPFHDAGTEDQGLGQGFLQQAGFLLKPGGVLWLVANKHLPYEALLRSLFLKVELVKEEGGFKVYKAER